jgi:prepilin-type N-terminal cleavage/methylation domain-containing protein
MCRSEKNSLIALKARHGFTLPEVLAALMILSLVCSGVLVVIDRCVSSAADLRMRMQAFETARNNMENLLASASVEEIVEYGTSEINPEIEWQMTVETFFEPITSRMWVQATCSAEYTDAEGLTQTVEFTHWLTNLTEQQLRELADHRDELEKQLDEAGQLIESAAEAAEYIGVDEETIRQWVTNGMRTTSGGYYIISELVLFNETDGKPTREQIRLSRTEAGLVRGRNRDEDKEGDADYQ